MKTGTRMGVAITFFSCCWGIASADSDTTATVSSYTIADTVPAAPQEFIVAERKDVALDVLELIQIKSRSVEIHEPDASFLKLHFSRFNIPKGITVEVRSPDGRESYRYTREGGDARTLNRKAGDDGRSGFLAMSISGDTAIVEVFGKVGKVIQQGWQGKQSEKTRAYVNSLKNRVHIDYYMVGYPEDRLAAAGNGTATVNSTLEASGPGVSKPHSICGIDERIPAACWEQSHPKEFDRSWPVARLLINGSRSCTAWRVGPGNVLFTNNHCIATQEVLETVEVWFNHQAINCGGTALEDTVKVAANTLFATNWELDFTLFSVQDFTSIEPFGYLGLDVRDAQLGERIYMPQHGFGDPKQIAIESDMNASGLCEVDDLHVDRYAPDTDIGYFCDSTGGSSGSPVLAGSSGRAIALHHFGGCVNSGVKMSLIWPEISGFFGGQVPAGDDETGGGENLPPVAQFGFACDETACSFDAGASADPDGTIVSFDWAFGDGATGAGVTVEHGYAEAGSYSVILTVVDNLGASDSVAQIVSVESANQPPVAAFQVSCNGLICTLDASLSSDADGSVASYGWAFGDNTDGTFGVPAVSHTYPGAGQYPVQLQVTDDDGATATADTLLTVSEPVPENQVPQASFTFSCQELTCDFDASGSTDPDGTLVSFDWAFDDGASGSGDRVSHTFGADGSYEVSLNVSDELEASSSATHIVQVAATVAPPISLSAVAGKLRNNKWVDLEWNDAVGSIVDVYRNGSVLATTDNDGSYRDSTVDKRDKVVSYRVCEHDTSTCSDEVTVGR